MILSLGEWNNVEDIDFSGLPNQFVLKCNHNSAKGMCICRDKSRLNIPEAKSRLKEALSSDFYAKYREWAYKDVPRKVIAEKYMTDESGEELKDYKVFCFNGEPKFIQLDYGRFSDHKRNLYSCDWEFMDVSYKVANDPKYKIEKPSKLDEMLELAKTLSSDIPFVRVDFYVVYDKIYFGELTFYPEAGLAHFNPPEFDLEIGTWLQLPSKID